MRLIAASLILFAATGWGQPPAQVQFFESRVRPVLIGRCGSCHGEKVQMGRLRLTDRESLHRSGVVMPGDLENSRLIQAIRYEGKIKMPPTGRLPANEAEALEKWVAWGAPWPESEAPAGAPKAEGYWAFQPVKKPAVPAVKNSAWPATEIDRFILARLEAKSLSPVADAGRHALLRRVSLDLTGLLPTPQEVDEFVRDSSPMAFERVVDRLLASPAFGDRWGRHWLDVTYYADTTGVGRRIPLPEAWRYRDYVIRSYNADKPFNQFIREQIAGPGGRKRGGAAGDDEALAATGFLVLGPWAWFSYDKVQVRWDVADLQADLVGRTFLGLTVGCARCHDHKFDPIPNKDYYGLVGIFLSTRTMSSANTEGGINMVRLPETTAMVRRYADDLEAWDKRVADAEAYDQEVQKEQAEVKKKIEELKARPRSTENDEAIKAAEKELAVLRKKTGTAPDRQILPFTRYMRPRLPQVYAAQDMEYPEDARIALRGDAHHLGESTPRRFLSAVHFGPEPEIDPHTSGRKELADWLSDDRNPLTPRVYVNRIWHHLFGEGIVATTDNFGSRGEPPTHPELLDYLAYRFLESGWSTKKLVREIVLSRAYRLSSAPDAKAAEIDPDNRLLWRANRRRLEVEALRDAILQVSGRLDPSRGGPSLPLTAANVHTIAPFFLEDDSVIEENVRYRRTVYQPIMRNSQMEGIDILNLFDFKDPDQVVGSRTPTTVPTQSLYLMNAPFVREESRRWAEALLKDPDLDDDGRISRVILTALSRPAGERDRQQARQFLSDFQAAVRKAREGAEVSSGDARAEAWSRYCHAILASSEFLFRR